MAKMEDGTREWVGSSCERLARYVLRSVETSGMQRLCSQTKHAYTMRSLHHGQTRIRAGSGLYFPGSDQGRCKSTIRADSE